MSERTIYAGGPNPIPEERYILRYWHEGDQYYQTHANGWHSATDAIAQAKAFQHSGWYVQVVDTRAKGY